MMLKHENPTPAEGEESPALSDLSRAARLVLEIAPGERRLLPRFGCRVHDLPRVDGKNAVLAAALIEEALEAWAPQLCVERAEVRAAGADRLAVRLRAAGVWHCLEITHRRPSNGESVGTEQS